MTSSSSSSLTPLMSSLFSSAPSPSSSSSSIIPSNKPGSSEVKRTINWRPKGNSGWNALHIAASNGDLPSLRACIHYSKLESDDDRLSLAAKRESKLDIATKQGDTAFHIALRKGHGQAARELAKAGCSVTIPGSRGEYAVHIATSRGMIDELQWLIEEYKFDVLTCMSGATGQYVQHFAAEEDRCDALRYLSTLGVDLNATDRDGETCFHTACRNGSVGAILLLAEWDFTLTKRVNREGKNGEALAREFGWSEAAERIALIARAKRRERKTNLEFHRLVSTSTTSLKQVEQWIAEHNAEVNLEILVDAWNYKNGTNTVLEACLGGNVEIVSFLINAAVAGERKFQNLKTGSTALHIAVTANNVELVRLLLKQRQTDALLKDKNGTTAFQLAEAKPEILKLLNDDLEQRRKRQAKTPPPTQIKIPENSSSSSESLGVNEEVRAILERVGLQGTQWLARFAEDGFVTVANLLHLVEADLLEMNMPKGFRRALLTELEQIRQKERHERRLVVRLHVQKVDLFLQKYQVLPDDLQVELIMSPTQTLHLTKQNQVFTCDCGAAVMPCEHVLMFRSSMRRSLSDIPQHFVIQVSELAIERVIGEGSYGVVRLATWRGMKVAVKELKGTQPGAELRREASTMARVSNHDHVVPLVGMVLEPIPSVVMAFMFGGSVEDLLFGPRAMPADMLPWYVVLKLIKEAACGVMHLHFQQVIHRDLSARNLLIDANGAVRVADFGFARIKEEHLSKGYTQSHVGPIKWMAPEAIRERKFSEKSDVFSFGVVMYEIISRERPWANKDSMDVVFRVCSGERMNIRNLAPWDSSVQQLMTKCWAQTPEPRPSMKEVLDQLELAWKRAGGGDAAADPTGGLVTYINSPQYQDHSATADVVDKEFDSDGYNVHF